MVKSPDLLNKEVSRGELLKFAGIGLGILAAGACAEKTGSAKPASPSTANIPRETADARPTPPPTPEATPTPEVVARPVDVREIVSPEKIAEVCSLPNFNTIKEKHTINGITNDEATKKELIDKIVKMFNYVTNPNLFNTDGQDVQVPSMASWSKREVAAGDMESYAGDPRLSTYLIEGLREHATDALPQYKEGMAEVMDWLENRAMLNNNLAVFSDPEGILPEKAKPHDSNDQLVPVTSDKKEFYRRFSLQPDGTEMIVNSDIGAGIALFFTMNTETNISPENVLSEESDFASPVYCEVRLRKPSKDDNDTPLKIVGISFQTDVKGKYTKIGG
jgi:hypothetical protein